MKRVREAPSAELDFFSDQFDPLLALRTPGLVPPVAAKPLDNLHKCRSILPTTDPNYAAPRQTRPTEPKVLSAEDLARLRAREHMQAVRKVNPIQRIADQHVDGPLGALKALYEEKAQLHVVTRGFGEIRGNCVGKLLAFDRHWNLVLSRVTERATVTNAAGERVTTTRSHPLLFLKGDGIVSITRRAPAMPTPRPDS
eukprot:TRINITY_DN1300_c0_g1_i2.p1 TRINITY_DN1300_c0_g1~~TRINITY_DN1300_c0_g1_i2.p1  ORF type:complete len:198 (+),score=30.21 TRINITY_DN1300_c0_g1_i2:158-751(+)